MYHSNLLNVQKTREIIEEFEIIVEKEIIDLEDGNTRVLAQDIMVMIDVPPFNRSAMDGYAVIPMMYPLHQNQTQNILK
jgi:Molybdopterin biosynthesis enzyme